MLNRIRDRFDFWKVMTIFLILFFVIFFAYPLFTMLIRSLQQKDVAGLTFANFKDFFTLKYYYSTLGHSLFVGIISTIIATAVGTLLAYLTTRYNVAGKSAVKIMFIVAFMSPPFIGAYSWIQLLGRAGFITKMLARIGIEMPPIYGKPGIILVFALNLSAYAYLYVSAALKNIDSSLEEAAENLGASKLKRLFTVTLPVILPTITSAMVIIFMQSLADFGTPLLIGEGYKTLPVLIYNSYLSEMGGNAYLASAFSVIIIFVAMMILVIQKAYVSKRNYTMSTMRPPQEVKLHGFKRFIVSFICWFWVFMDLLPQITVITTSFMKTKGPVFVEGWTFDHYIEVFKTMGSNIKHTLTYSTLAIILILVIGVMTAFLSVRRRKEGGALMDFLAMMPYVIPGAVLGICFIVTFNRPPILIGGTALILIIAYTVRKMPYTIRSSVGILQQIEKSVDEASINLGVSPAKTFLKITVPLMAPGVVSGAILSWIACVNELSSTLLLYSGKTATMSISIYTNVIKNNNGPAAAMATIMTLFIVIALLVFFKVSKGKVDIV